MYEPKTDSGMSSFSTPLKSGEEIGDLLSRDARPLIDNRGLDKVAYSSEYDPDHRFRVAIFSGVGEQIAHSLLYPSWISQYGWDGAFYLKLDRMPFGDRLYSLCNLADQGNQIDRFPIQF